ncbi:MAG: amidase [Myxococcota bacterium]
MRPRSILVLLLLLAGCDRYQDNDLELLTAYRAKELCSCLFVMGQTEDYCRAYTVAAPNLARFEIDRAGKTVRASAVLMWNARARWVSSREGCRLD